MQIRRRKNKIEFLRSEYRAEKGRSFQVMIGSQDYFLDRLEPELKEKMTDAEIIEAKAFFEEKRSENKALSNRVAVNSAASEIRKATKALEAGQEVRDADQAAEIYRAMADLSKQLKRSGYPKSAVVPKNKTAKSE